MFHVVTWRLFPIGVFPWVMIAASTVFFAPDWPRRLARRRRARGTTCVVVAANAPTTPPDAHPVCRVLVVVAGWSGSRCRSLIPLRHLVIPGDYRWTNEGYRFAWVVLLTEKGGDVSFRVHRPRDRTHAGSRPRDDLYTPHAVADDGHRARADPPGRARDRGASSARHGRDVEVRADAFVSLNGRPAARLVRPRVDLAREPWRIHQPWILPRRRSAPLPGR